MVHINIIVVTVTVMNESTARRESYSECLMWNVRSEGNDDDDVCWMDAVCFMQS